MKSLILLISLLTCFLAYSQTDSVGGNVKSIREKIIFLDSNIQQARLFASDGDYGHSGYTDPTSVQNHFNDIWFNTYWCTYVNSYRQFDSLGRLWSESWYEKNGWRVDSIIYYYDKMNQRVRETSYGYKRKNNISDFQSIKSFSYDYWGRLQSELTFFDFNPRFSDKYYYTSYSYDDKNHLVLKREFNEAGFIEGARYGYSEKGLIQWIQRISGSRIEKKGDTTFIIKDTVGYEYIEAENFYNDAGKIIRSNKYGLDDKYERFKLKESSTYQYDKHQRLTQEAYESEDSFVRSAKNLSYYNNGKLKSKSIFNVKSKTILYLVEYEYYPNGMVQKLKYAENNRIYNVSFEYKFDNNGNWIMQIKSVDNRPLFHRTRELVYW